LGEADGNDLKELEGNGDDKEVLGDDQGTDQGNSEEQE